MKIDARNRYISFQFKRYKLSIMLAELTNFNTLDEQQQKIVTHTDDKQHKLDGMTQHTGE